MKAQSKAVAATIVAMFLAVWVSTCVPGRAQEGELKSVLITAKEKALEESYLLRYKFTAGEVLQWKVRHLGTTETTVQGNMQVSKMDAKSTKQWKVTEVDDEGNFTFVYSVLDVDMWQKRSGLKEVRYNSQEDETAPPEYVAVAKSVGVPIATVQITPSGQVLSRDKAPVQVNSGLGEIAVPLPLEPVKIGQGWHSSNEVRVRRQDGQQMRVKIRLAYTFESVKTGIATIQVKTEVLTPVNDPHIEAQLVQQLTNGELKFDIDAGRLVARQSDWDKTVVGFSGNNSMMKYLARFTEELIPAEKVARDAADEKVR